MLLSYFNVIQVLLQEVTRLKNALHKCKNTKEREVIQKQIDEFETIISNFKKITDSFIDNCKDETIKKIIIDCYYNNKSFNCALDLYAPFEDDEDDEDDENNKKKKRTYTHHYGMYQKRISRLLTKL